MLVLLTPASGAHAEIAISIEAGYPMQTRQHVGSRSWNLNSWNPACVAISGTSPRGTATLQLKLASQVPGSVPITYIRRIALSGGFVSQVVRFVLPPSPQPPAYSYGTPGITLTARLLYGRQVSSQIFTVPFQDLTTTPPMQVLLLSKSGDLTYLLSSNTRAVPDFSNTSSNLARSIYWRTHLRLLLPPDGGLPENPLGYEAASAVVLHNFPLDQLNARQLQALQQYVYSGGLLITSGGDFSELQNTAVSALLPVVPLSVVTVSKLGTLRNFAGAALSIPGGISMTVAQPKPGATILCTDRHGHPVIAGIRRGSGYVLFCSFDLFNPAVRRYSHVSQLWKRLLERDSRQHEIFKLSRITNMSLSRELAGPRASAMPSVILFALFCTVYVVLVAPINFYVLKRLDRKELSWVTIPLLVAIFTFAAIIIQRSLKGTHGGLRTAVILQSASGSHEVSGAIQSSLFAIEQGKYHFSFRGSPNAGVDCTGFSPLPVIDENPYSALVGMGDGAEIDDNSPASIKLPVPAYSARTVGCAFCGKYAGVSVDILSMSQTEIKLRVQNNLAQSLTDAKLLLRNYPVRLSLPPTIGGNISNVPFDLFVPDCPAHSTKIYQLSTQGLKQVSLPADFEDYTPVKTGLHPSLIGYVCSNLTYPTSTMSGLNLPQHAWRPRFVAWNSEPIANVKVNGTTLSRFEQNLYVISVSDSSLRHIPPSVSPTKSQEIVP